MFNIGPQELLVILLVALVIVGPQRLPELARTIGRALRELRRAQDEVTRTIQLGLEEAEPRKPPPARPTPRERAPAEDAGRATPGPEQDQVTDVARALGRGLSEIRRARREIQRSFRIDLTEDPAPRPAERRPPTPTDAPGEAG